MPRQAGVSSGSRTSLARTKHSAVTQVGALCSLPAPEKKTSGSGGGPPALQRRAKQAGAEKARGRHRRRFSQGVGAAPEVHVPEHGPRADADLAAVPGGATQRWGRAVVGHKGGYVSGGAQRGHFSGCPPCLAFLVGLAHAVLRWRCTPTRLLPRRERKRLVRRSGAKAHGCKVRGQRCSIVGILLAVQRCGVREGVVWGRVRTARDAAPRNRR